MPRRAGRVGPGHVAVAVLSHTPLLGFSTAPSMSAAVKVQGVGVAPLVTHKAPNFRRERDAVIVVVHREAAAALELHVDVVVG